jgi:hypothetical protein
MRMPAGGAVVRIWMQRLARTRRGRVQNPYRCQHWKTLGPASGRSGQGGSYRFPPRMLEAPRWAVERDCKYTFQPVETGPVAQWIEHQIPNLRVAGSNPAGVAITSMT